MIARGISDMNMTNLTDAQLMLLKALCQKPDQWLKRSDIAALTGVFFSQYHATLTEDLQSRGLIEIKKKSHGAMTYYRYRVTGNVCDTIESDDA